MPAVTGRTRRRRAGPAPSPSRWPARAPSRPSRNRPCCRLDRRARACHRRPATGHRRALASDQGLGGDLERAARSLGRRPSRRRAGGRGRRVELRRARRPADPEPGDRGVAPGVLRGLGKQCRPPRASAMSAATSGSSAASDRLGDVGLGRIGQIAERHRAPDDRHRVARLEPLLAVVAPPSRADAVHVARPTEDRQRIEPAARRHRRERRDRRRHDRVVSLEIAGPVRIARPGGSSPMRPVESSNRVGASQRAPCGKTRMSPLASRTRKPTARSSRTCRSAPGTRPLARSWRGSRRRHALERRDQRQLGRLDDAAHPDLAGRQRGDPRGRGVADRVARPVAAACRGRAARGRRRRRRRPRRRVAERTRYPPVHPTGAPNGRVLASSHGPLAKRASGRTRCAYGSGRSTRRTRN